MYRALRSARVGLNVHGDVTPTNVLIGKDGGVKLRQEELVRPAELFALIDSMPMRKHEMGRRSQ